ncbi:MAG: hypothetical protein ACLU3I_00255 [Acutalibacteraceae bacterium]
MAVLRPVKLVITNYPGGQERDLRGREQPRPIPTPGTHARSRFSREAWIEADDFLADADPQVQAPVPQRS